MHLLKWYIRVFPLSSVALVHIDASSEKFGRLPDRILNFTFRFVRKQIGILNTDQIFGPRLFKEVFERSARLRFLIRKCMFFSRWSMTRLTFYVFSSLNCLPRAWAWLSYNSYRGLQPWHQVAIGNSIIMILIMITIIVPAMKNIDRDDNIKTTFERVRSEFGCVVKSNEVDSTFINFGNIYFILRPINNTS